MKLVLKETLGTPPVFHFELYEDEIVVGKLQLRQTPAKDDGYPEGFESHLYFEIEPAYREKGYGIEILRLGLLEAKNIGLRRVTLTCTDENKAAQKIIQENSGQFVESKPAANGQMIHKYKIDFS